MLLADPAYTVPDPGPPGPYGTMAWLRATVSRFCEGETHARRRAIVEALLAELDPADLREAAAELARGGAANAPAAIDAPYVPVAVLAAALGVAPRDLGRAVAATRVVAAAYHPHTDAPGADAGLSDLLTLLGEGEPDAWIHRFSRALAAVDCAPRRSDGTRRDHPEGARPIDDQRSPRRRVIHDRSVDTDEVVAQRVALLVQACEATAALVRGDDLPVPVTRRVGPDERVVLVDLAGHPFGAGPRRCPGEAHALALVEGVVGR